MKLRAASSRNANPYGRFFAPLTFTVFATLCFFLGVPAVPAQTAEAPAVAKAPTKASAKTSQNQLSSPAIESKVNALLTKMTLEEKIGQLVQYSAGAATGPTSGRTDDKDMIRKGQVGSLFNVTGAHATNELQHVAVDESRLHIPLIFGLDVIHGFRTTFPLNLGLAATWDPDLVQKTTRIAAQEASASGVRWTFSPMVDIARDARWGRMSEGAGEDPFLGSAMARAYVRGYQGEHLDAPDSIVACAKHYVGYGAAEGGRDYNSTEISEHTLREYYLPPFRAAAEAGSGTFMSAFNSLNGIPTSANPFTIKQILKKEWGFQGFVVSDWTSVSEVMAHGIAIDGATAARKAFLAGVDMDMQSNLYHQNMLNLVQSGKVPQAAIDDGVRRILRVKFAMGLFDHPYTDESKESGAFLRPESVAVAKTAGTRSIVLLRNESVSGTPLLPLSAKVSSVALIGPLADDAGNMIGSWGALGRGEDAVTLRRALSQKLGESRTRYAKGGNFLDASDSDISAAVSAAQNSDVAVLALGEDAPSMTGEAASRAWIGLPGRQQELLEKVVAAGKPVVLILFSGRPLTLPWAFEHVPAVLAAWYPGVQAGNALADLLLGDAAPTGHLPLSWPRSVGQEPLYYNALNTGRPAADPDHPAEKGETKYVSRYIDEKDTPQYPFGFGLTYTTFRYGATSANAKELSMSALRRSLAARKQGGKVISVSADVTNTGSRAGETMAQLYVRLDGTSIAMPVRMLKGFQSVTLGPGESRKVTFDVDAESFAFWGAENTFGVEPARVTLWVAPSSAEGEPTALNIAER
ncbi:MAG TPA: glycoside hydrolase family 3 N-terminal domain-containing protein [Candidatus Acidoferrum sp.]|nr:glycoside hydrolase family 3 N-terminal domain-containing protein [Candidatus Acidoferrum sp.]